MARGCAWGFRVSRGIKDSSFDRGGRDCEGDFTSGDDEVLYRVADTRDNNFNNRLFDFKMRIVLNAQI